MTPTRLRECLDLIGWTQHGLAKHLGINESRPRRWAAGKYPIPEHIAEWLERLASFHEQNPPPMKDTR